MLSDGEFDGVFDEEGADDFFDGELIIVGQFLDLFPILE